MVGPYTYVVQETYLSKIIRLSEILLNQEEGFIIMKKVAKLFNIFLKTFQKKKVHPLVLYCHQISFFLIMQFLMEEESK